MPQADSSRAKPLARFLPAAVAMVAAAISVPASAQVLPLELLVDESRVVLGEEVQIVVRTVESRQLSSITFGLEMRDEDGVPTILFDTLVSAAAFAGTAGNAGDATIQTQWNPVTQRIDVTLDSPTATLNELFGPLAVLRFTLDPIVGTLDRPRFEIALDPDMVVLDALAESVVMAPANGRVRIVDLDPAQGLGALGGEVFPGGNMVLGAMTVHPYAIGGGTFELLYDASLADGPPVVGFDARYGAVVVDDLDVSLPGRVLVTFHSDGGVYNAALHGAIFTVVVPSRADVPIGTSSIVSIGALTALVDAAGDPILLETDFEQLDFIDPEVVAAAAFEGGNFAEWWTIAN
ncbi:MAG: hypothetical protein KBF21_20335 [Thermoanaerobaculia bacterium]|nr:hypothetical protein [Thermoanaerobaculia bacterium]MBP9899717.1 hypothetical protein [Gemmatimonadales bacterium]